MKNTASQTLREPITMNGNFRNNDGPTYSIHDGIEYVFQTNFTSNQLDLYQQAIQICGKDDYLIGTSIGRGSVDHGYSLWVKRDVVNREHIKLFDVLNSLDVKRMAAGSRISYRFELSPPKHLHCINYHIHNPKATPGSVYRSTGGILALFRLCDERDAYTLALLLAHIGDLTDTLRTPLRGRYIHHHKNRKLRSHTIKQNANSVTGQEVYLLRRLVDSETNLTSSMEIYRPKDGVVIAKFDGFNKEDIYCSAYSMTMHLKRVVDHLNRLNRTVPTYTF